MRKQTLKIYGIIILSGILYAIWISYNENAVECFYLKTTGFKCPACGITRMFISISHLDFYKAFCYNPFMFTMFFAWNIIGILSIWNKFKFAENPKFYYICLFISLGLMLIFWFYRIVAC